MYYKSKTYSAPIYTWLTPVLATIFIFGIITWKVVTHDQANFYSNLYYFLFLSLVLIFVFAVLNYTLKIIFDHEKVREVTLRGKNVSVIYFNEIKRDSFFEMNNFEFRKNETIYFPMNSGFIYEMNVNFISEPKQLRDDISNRLNELTKEGIPENIDEDAWMDETEN